MTDTLEESCMHAPAPTPAMMISCDDMTPARRLGVP